MVIKCHSSHTRVRKYVEHVSLTVISDLLAAVAVCIVLAVLTSHSLPYQSYQLMRGTIRVAARVGEKPLVTQLQGIVSGGVYCLHNLLFMFYVKDYWVLLVVVAMSLSVLLYIY